MKKPILMFGAMALSFSVALAQTGNNNSSSTSQTGNGNSITAAQLGNDNSSTVGQQGDGNTGNVTQGGFGGGAVQSNNAIASIQQIGNSNLAEVNQRQGFAGGTFQSEHSTLQSGDGNEAILTTFNGGNTGQIRQFGNLNFARGRQSLTGGNIIDILQQGDENTGEVQQTGSLNIAVISQSESNGSGSQGWITQTGVANQGRVWQISGGGFSEIVQNGDNNQSFNFQNGFNVFDSYQFGNDNSIGNYFFDPGDNASQDNFGGLADANSASISQVGDGNRATLNQKKGGSVMMDVLGNGNSTLASQQGFIEGGVLNTIIMNVTGDQNLAIGYQQGEGNSGTIDINGNNNNVALQVGAAFDSPSFNTGGDANTQTISVDGNGNFARTRAFEGSSNIQQLSQIGEGNYGVLSLSGSFNELELIQEGNTNFSEGFQSGNSNMGTISILGNLNTSLLTQTGMGNSASQTIMGNGNSSTITQN